MARETWTGRAGFVLAAVGSAVGLGNLWRFPWVTAGNGGSAFLIVYLGLVLGVGVPGLLAEFVIGRRARRDPVGAFRDLADSRIWGLAGAFGVLTAVAILAFYTVVGGWVLRYLVESAVGVVLGSPAYFAEPAAYFGGVAAGPDAVAYHLLFLLLTAGIVFGGVRDGIEAATKLMMPAIFLLLVGLAVWAATRSGASEAYAFFLRFDLGTVRANFFDVLGPAVGQALFTLSVGVGGMITYASYLGEDRSLPADAATIAVLNTVVGVLAGLVVFPLLFAQGIDPAGMEAGPGALFVGLAGAFAALPAGSVVATLFFATVVLAALSSAISLLEIPVAVLVDEADVDRRRAVGGVSVVLAVAGTATALSSSLFGFVAGPLVNVMVSVGLLLFLLFVAWTLGREATAEFTNGAGPLASRLATPWLAVAGVALPLFLTFTLLTDLGVAGAVGFWPTVALAVVGVGAFAAASVAVRRRAVTA